MEGGGGGVNSPVLVPGGGATRLFRVGSRKLEEGVGGAF